MAALPLLAISAHVFGIAPMNVTAGLLVVPLTLVTLLLGVFSPSGEERLLLSGAMWGVLATLVYDAVRLDTVYLLGWWGDFIPRVGTWILGSVPPPTTGPRWSARSWATCGATSATAAASASPSSCSSPPPGCAGGASAPPSRRR